MTTPGLTLFQGEAITNYILEEFTQNIQIFRDMASSVVCMQEPNIFPKCVKENKPHITRYEDSGKNSKIYFKIVKAIPRGGATPLPFPSLHTCQ